MGVLRLEEMNRIHKNEVVPEKKQNEVVQIHKQSERKNYFMEEQNNKVISTRNVNQVWDAYMNRGWIDGKQYSLGPFNGIKNAWKNKPAFIIGSGPDLKIFIKEIGWNFLNGKHSLGINHTIESYGNFEWFIFLDRRFLKKTTFNMFKYKGKIFAQNNTGISSAFNNVVRYRCRNNFPTLDITNGLYSSRFSGLAALNLALIAGANPIFLIGFGMGKDGTAKQFHFRDKYQGVGQHPIKQFEKYKKVYNHFKMFKRWYPSIVHVTEGDSIAGFRKMTFQTFKKKFAINGMKKKEINIIEKKHQPIIAHMSFCSDKSRHADITRAIMDGCYGNHSMHNFNHGIPQADMYITEHFISTNKFIQVFPYKNKAINIVHSMNCVPLGNWKHNIALTNYWQRWLQGKGVQNIRVIYGGIDLEPYEQVTLSKEKVFGRITRWSPGKIPFWWNRLVNDVLSYDENVKCIMFINNIHSGRKLMNHKRMIYDQTCKITDFKGNWLKKLKVYVHANGNFRETMSHAVIEAMATGLPVIYLKEPAVSEVVGAAGVGCVSESQVRESIIKLLYNEELFDSYSKLSKARSKVFDINKTVKTFDNLIKEMVGAI